MRALGGGDPPGPDRRSVAAGPVGPGRRVDPVGGDAGLGRRPVRPPDLQLPMRGHGEARPGGGAFMHRPAQRVEGRDVQRRHHRQAMDPRQPRRVAVQGIVVDHVETARQQRLCRPGEARVHMGVQHIRPVEIVPGKAAVVVVVEDREQPRPARQPLGAVAAGKERDIVPRPHQRVDEVPGMRLHPAHEGRCDGVPDMRDDRDPHHSAATRGGTGVRRSDWSRSISASRSAIGASEGASPACARARSSRMRITRPVAA